MPREIRLVILSSASSWRRILGTTIETRAGRPRSPTGILVLYLALGIILIGAIITVIQRIVHVRRTSQTSHTTTTIDTN